MTIMLANVDRLAREVIAAALRPPPGVDYLAWAERHVVIEEGSYPGPYNRALFPYFDEILRALGPEDPCRFVTLAGSAQIGKTTLANIFTCGSLDMATGNFLYVHPTDDNARRWSKMKLAPMMRSIAVMREQFPQRTRDNADSVTYKERKDGLAALLITGANSPAALSQVTVERQVQDDLSKYELNSAGDPEVQAESRSRAIEFAKLLKISTPLIMPGCKITRNFEAGSREYPYVPCPHCAHMQVLEWDNMLGGLDPAKPEDAHFTCIACGGIIEEHHRPQMLAGFEWRAQNPAARREHRSFWIWSAYSYLQSWSRIAQEWLKARGDPAAEKVFLNDTAGKAYHARGEARPWEELRDRAAQSHYRRGTVPPGALLLMLGIDCQEGHVEFQVVGFGKNYHRYVVEYGIVERHISDIDCQRNLDLVLARTWKNTFGREIGISFTAIDGNAYTEDVWAFARRHPASKLIMVRGRGDEGAARLALVKRERNPKTGQLLRYSKRFYHLGVSILKMALYRNLAEDDPLAAGYVSFPSGLEDEYFQELTAERRVPVKRGGRIVHQWVKDRNQNNEALDTLIQATGAAMRYGVYGMSDQSWDALAQKLEVPIAVQGDLEDLLSAAGGPPAVAQQPKRRSLASMLPGYEGSE